MLNLEQLQKLIDQIKDGITQGNFLLILLSIVVSLYWLGRPEGGEVIKSLPRRPNWYPSAFWQLEGALSILFLALLISKSLAFFILLAILAIILWFYRGLVLLSFKKILTKINEFWNYLKQSKGLIVIFIFGAIVTTLFYYSTQVQPPKDPQVVFANEVDRFSFGENILIPKESVFKNDSSCQKHWDIKEQGKDAYFDYVHGDKAKLEQASKSFNDFILWCQNDPEAHIYRNNTSAMRHNPIHIAVSVPLRGVSIGVFDSQEILRGVALAQTEINDKNGIYGRRLLVGIADDGFSSNDDEAVISRKIADFFVNEMPRIIGVVGHSSSDTTLVAGKIYDKKLVAISPTSTAIRKFSNNDSQTENLAAINLSSYVFRTASNDAVAAKNLIKYITDKQQKISKIAIVYESKDSYSNSFKKIFEAELKKDLNVVKNSFKIVENEDECNLSYGNFFELEKCLEQAQKAGALLLIPGDVFAAQESVNNLIEKVDNNVILLGGDTMYTESLLSSPKANRMVVAVPWHRSQSDSESRFERAAYLKFGKRVNWRTAMAYDATQALIKGLEKASTKCSWLNPLRYAGEAACLRQELKNALSSANFKADGALGAGTVRFENGDRVSPGTCQDEQLKYQVGVLVEAVVRDAVVRDKKLGYFQLLEPQSSPICPDN